MGDYNRNDRGGRSQGGGRNYGGGRSQGGGGFRGRDSGRREMFDAVCDNCGNDCKVPFRPSGDKPIYCSNCFETKGGGQDRPRRDFRDAPTKDNSSKQLVEQLSSINSKLERILRVMEGVSKPEAKTKEKEIKKATPKPKKAKPKKTTKKKVK